MSNLTKDQKDELVTSYAALALYDGDVSSRSSRKEGGEEGMVGGGKWVENARDAGDCFFHLHAVSTSPPLGDFYQQERGLEDPISMRVDARVW